MAGRASAMWSPKTTLSRMPSSAASARVWRASDLRRRSVDADCGPRWSWPAQQAVDILLRYQTTAEEKVGTALRRWRRRNLDAVGDERDALRVDAERQHLGAGLFVEHF
jgi:hypothetical protein